jgi:serine protease AprX
LDGYAKPDIVAPGTDIISLLSNQSSWPGAYPQRAVGNGYFRLSGTSMSAPMVTGAVALLLQDEPNLTPDQVKYRLTYTAGLIAGPPIYETTDPISPMAEAASILPPTQPVLSYYSYLDVAAAVNGTTTQSANTGLAASQLLWSGSEPINWSSVNWTSVNWNSVNWTSVNWTSVNWTSVNWNSVTVTEIGQYLNGGTLPAGMVWETPVWPTPGAPHQGNRLLIPSIGK